MEDTVQPPAVLGFTSAVSLRTNRPGTLGARSLSFTPVPT